MHMIRYTFHKWEEGGAEAKEVLALSRVQEVVLVSEAGGGDARTCLCWELSLT